MKGIFIPHPPLSQVLPFPTPPPLRRDLTVFLHGILTLVNGFVDIENISSKYHLHSFAVLSSQQMTIGKIYCAKLIYENYKHMKKKRLEKKKKVREVCQDWSPNLDVQDFYPTITFSFGVYFVTTIGSYIKTSVNRHV